MSDGGAPQLGDDNTGHYSDLDTPSPANADIKSNGNGSTQETLNSLLSAAQSAKGSLLNHPTTQGLKDTMQNGPVAQNVKAESAKTSAEFRDLADARKTPAQPAATGQPLTHYHSMFYRLLSWKNPRATSISFVTSVLFIFAARYVNILRYVFKVLYIVLGVTAVAELTGKTMFGTGFATQFRPRKYWIIPKASLERFLDDAEQLINFFVIEFQRVVFAENVYVTLASFVAAFCGYWLIKWLPLWGLSLLSTSLIYLGPLIYIKNKEVIDAQLQSAGDMASQQARQIKDLGAQHLGRASETARQRYGEYTHKAQETFNQYRGRSGSPEVSSKPVKSDDFPTAPKEEPVKEASPEPEPEAIAS